MGAQGLFDDLVAGLVDQVIDFMITGFGARPGIGDVFVGAGVELIQQEASPCGVIGLAGDPLHIVQYVSGHSIYMVKALEVIGYELAGLLLADVDAMEAGHFLRQLMGHLSGMVAVGAGAVDFPVETGLPGFVLQDPFCEGAAADIAQTNHENGIHGRKSTMRGAKADDGGANLWKWGARGILEFRI